MWVDEKEIMYLIQNNIRYIPGLNPNDPLPCYDQAAHAIAEKMREGVIHQESGVIDAYWQRPQNSSEEEGTFFWALDAGESYSDFSIYLGRDGDKACVGLEDGQRVRVTVTREDKDGQE